MRRAFASVIDHSQTVVCECYSQRPGKGQANRRVWSIPSSVHTRVGHTPEHLADPGFNVPAIVLVTPVGLANIRMRTFVILVVVADETDEAHALAPVVAPPVELRLRLEQRIKAVVLARAALILPEGSAVEPAESGQLRLAGLGAGPDRG